MNKVICGIYVITNLLNNKHYIGQSKDIYERWKNHKRQSTWRSHPNKALYTAFDKYGIENFEFEIIEMCDLEDLDRREIYYISEYDSYKNGYNRTLGGQGYIVDEDTYYKNRLKAIYSMDLSKIKLKMKPLYVTTRDSFDEFVPIYTKKKVNEIRRERKERYDETFEIDIDYIPYNREDNTHLYITLASVNRYLHDNITELETNYYINRMFNENEFNMLYEKLKENIEMNEMDINNTIDYRDIDEWIIRNNSTTPKDSIYDLIPDYDELGGDDYFEACYF